VDGVAAHARQFSADVGVVLVLVEIHREARRGFRQAGIEKAADLGLEAGPRIAIHVVGISVANDSVHDGWFPLNEWVDAMCPLLHAACRGVVRPQVAGKSAVSAYAIGVLGNSAPQCDDTPELERHARGVFPWPMR